MAPVTYAQGGTYAMTRAALTARFYSVCEACRFDQMQWMGAYGGGGGRMRA